MSSARSALFSSPACLALEHTLTLHAPGRTADPLLRRQGLGEPGRDPLNMGILGKPYKRERRRRRRREERWDSVKGLTDIATRLEMRAKPNRKSCVAHENPGEGHLNFHLDDAAASRVSKGCQWVGSRAVRAARRAPEQIAGQADPPGKSPCVNYKPVPKGLTTASIIHLDMILRYLRDGMRVEKGSN